MSEFNNKKHVREEEEAGGRKKMRVDLKSLSDAQIKRILLAKILKRKTDNPERYERSKEVCKEAHIAWNLDKKAPTMI